jgi:thiamine kinase-like enzyme
MLTDILKLYGITNATQTIFGNGLINSTWKIIDGENEYILQKLNSSIFTNPNKIDENINAIGNYLTLHYPQYNFVQPIKASNGNTIVCLQNEYYRLFPFVKNAVTKNVLQTAKQAYEAAKQFGKFTKLLSGFNAAKLNITLPNFHNLTIRYQQFLLALQTGNKERIAEATVAIKFINEQINIVNEYEQIKTNTNFIQRVTHHDTKISNVIFNEKNEGLCVIDYDTIMPGYFISDVGDMMRTYLSPVDEEESDFTKIEIRVDIYKAIEQGYLSEMHDELTVTEKKYFFFAGTYMIYMQAMRFLTDYLNNDIYYGAKYEKQNFVRAQNQIVLLEKLLEKKSELCVEI